MRVCVCVYILDALFCEPVILPDLLLYVSSLFLCMVFIAVVVLGGETYDCAFVLDSGKVDDINGILNDTSCVILLLLLLG